MSITQIAEEFATGRTASAVCNLGVNVSRNCTLTYWLVEALNAATGNVDRPGGLLFNPGILDMEALLEGLKQSPSSAVCSPWGLLRFARNVRP